MTEFPARQFLKLTGWRPEGAKPTPSKCVIIAYPHTSNWDLAYLLALSQLFELKISWIGKHTLFRGPAGPVMRRLGGISIRRDRRENVVQQMAAAFREHESLALVVPAEGTRGYVPYWKSGFYRIALAAEVPIVLGFLDYARKRGGFGPALQPTGDLRGDMDQVRAFYRDKVGKYPDQAGEVRLKEEM